MAAFQRPFIFSGGSGWIRTSSGLSQQIYSLPRLSNSGARPNLFATTFMARHTKPWRSVVRAEGIEPSCPMGVGFQDQCVYHFHEVNLSMTIELLK